MFFNEKKFELLAISATTKDAVYQTPTTGLPIEKKSTLRDLGIHFQEDLSFNQNIATLPTSLPSAFTLG